MGKSQVYMDHTKYLKLIDKVKNFDPTHLHVHHDTFENVIPRYNNDFLYLDPPYYLHRDSKMFKGIYPQRNFPIHHNHFNHQLLKDLLTKHQGPFILSYNDCTPIREWYKDFEIINVKWQYTMGQGEKRIGKNRLNTNTTHVKASHKILIIKR